MSSGDVSGGGIRLTAAPALTGLFLVSLLLLLISLLPSFAAADETTTLRVGIYQNSPKVFLDEDGSAKGIFVDIIDDVARQEGWQLQYVSGTWEQNLDRLEKGELDVVPDMSYSPARAERFTLSGTPVVESWLDVYCFRDVHIRSIRDLANRKIAVLRGSIQEDYLSTEVSDAFGIDFTLLLYDDYPASVEAVKSGEADLMVATRFYYFSPTRDEELMPANVILRPENLHFAYPRDFNPEIVAAVDRRVASMKNDPDSAYYESLQRWMNVEPRTLIPDSARYALGIISVLLTTLGIFALILRRQVTSRTRELKAGNQELRESEERWRSYVVNAPYGVFLADDRERFLEVNPSACRITGYDEAELLDMSLSDLAIPEPEERSVDGLPDPWWETAGPSELVFRHKSGDLRWWSIMRVQITDERRLGFIEDITERKQAELAEHQHREQVLLSKRMELVGRLAGGVAHDFNNMLSVIIGFTELAMRQVDPAAPLSADLGEILDAARRSTDITRQLLAFARKQSVAPQIIDLNQAVDGVLKMLERLIGEDICLKFRAGDDLSLVRMDPSQLDQILANLCVNSRDAIEDVGQVTIETKNVAFDRAWCEDHAGFIPGEYVLLSVSDNGWGMDGETLERIFEPYFTTKKLADGTGLGLATVFGIVKQNLGFIKVYSEPEQGTTFNIYLPRYAGDSAEPEPETDVEVPRGNGETILLVEDEVSILDLAARILEGLGYTILSATSPTAAERLAEEFRGRIDLLITDVVMPEINGRDLADRIGAHRPGMACLFMSGYTADVVAGRGVLDEGLPFIQKPFSRNDLAQKVRAMLDKRDRS